MKMYHVKGVLLLIAIISGTYVHAQPSTCKVLMESISATYSGKCRKGLAHGMGIAQGIDHYRGQFNKGLPNGQGIYTWSDGSYYDGQWKAGMKEGKGKMIFADSVVTGFWKNDQFVGEMVDAPYKVIYSLSVPRYSFSKSSPAGYLIRLRIMQGGSDNATIEDFSLAYTSGDEYRNGPYFCVQNITFPVDVKVKYRAWNQLRTSQFNVIFEFTISEPGTWDVTISN